MKSTLMRIKNSPFIISALMVGLSFCVCYIINGFNINISNDDLLMEIQLYKGHYDTIFINWFLSAFLIPLQSVFKQINVLACSQLIINIISFIAIVYTVLKRRNRELLSLFISIIALVVFSSFGFVHLQWTITATISATAGYVLLFLLECENKTQSIIKYIVGCILLLYSSFLRNSSFLSVSAIIGTIVFLASVIKIFKTIELNSNSIRNEVFKCIKPVVCVVLIIVLSYTLGLASESIKNSTISGYTEYKHFNSVRSSAADYGLPSFNEHSEYYKSIGITSQNDLDVYQTWIHDDSFFTIEKLQNISDFSKRPDVGYKFSIGLLFNLLKNKISEYTSINPIIILIVFCLFLLAIVITLFIKRNKVKLLFPFVLVIIWIAYFYVFRLNPVNILMIGVAALSIIISFLYNRYYYILSLVLSIISIGLYTYLNFGRPIFRASFTFIFPTFIVLLCLISDTSYLRKTKIIESIINKKVFTIALIIIGIASSVVFGYFGWNSEVKPKDNKQIAEYIRSHTNQYFVSSIWQCYDMTTNALLFNDIPDNVLVYGWLDGSEFDTQRKEQFKIDSLYTSLLDRDDMFFTTHENSKALIEKYYNEHYDKDIKIAQIVKYDEFGVYSVER